MTCVGFCGWEMGDSDEADAVSGGNWEVTAAVKHAGGYSLYVTGQNGYHDFHYKTALGADGNIAHPFFSGWYRPANFGTTDHNTTCTIDGFNAYIIQNTDGTLQLKIGDATDDSTTVLSIGSWYWVEYEVVNSGENIATAHLYVNGVLEATLTDVACVGASSDLARVGQLAVEDAEFYWDDMYFDDAAFPSYTTTPPVCGTIIVGDAEGSRTDWSLGAGASKVAAVATEDGDTGYLVSTVGADVQTFTQPGTGDYDGCVAVIATGIWKKAGRSSGTHAYPRTYGYSGITAYASSPSSTPTYVWELPLFRDLNPDDAAVWSEADIDALEFGIASNVIVSAEARMTMCALMVVYEPQVVVAGNVLKISGVLWDDVKVVSGVAEASISKVSGVTAN